MVIILSTSVRMKKNILYGLCQSVEMTTSLKRPDMIGLLSEIERIYILNKRRNITSTFKTFFSKKKKKNESSDKFTAMHSNGVTAYTHVIFNFFC